MPKWLSTLLLCGLILLASLSVSACSSGDDTPPPSSSSNSPTTPGTGLGSAGIAYVKASNPGGGTRPPVPTGATVIPGDNFGFSIALSDDTLVVGAPHEASCASGINGDQTSNGCQSSGAVYVFIRSNGTWSQQAYIKASNTQAGDNFGHQVAVSGDILAVSAVRESSCARGINANQMDNGCLNAGAVYVFTRTNGVWSQQAYIKASNAQAGHNFGWKLALDSETFAVGANGDASCASGVNGDPSGTSSACFSGAAYVFTRTNGVWTQQAYIKPPNRLDNVAYTFGDSVAISGDRLAVGATAEGGCTTGVNGDETAIGCFSGAVYVYARANGSWTKEAYIKASNTQFSDVFGSNVALSADTLAVAASNESSCATGVNGDQFNNACNGAGAVYVFTRTNGTWSQQAYVKASNTERDDLFGGSNFGASIAVLGDTLAVGARNEDSCATGVNGNQDDNSCGFAGSVYVFNRRAGVWTQAAYVKAPNTDPGDGFGTSVALSTGTMAIGAPGESSCMNGINGNQTDNNCGAAGAVYVFIGQ